MPAFYISSEASIKYIFTSPSGARAVLNDPTDADFCGYLDGEEALSGIDSPEIRDSFAEFADADGAMAGTNFRGRRPIVMNGRVIPTSAADRNAKLGKLQAATSAFEADGTLMWTPSGGEPVFLKFRTQLPFRAKGGFNKEFQIGLVANDPRIYTVRAMTLYSETNGNSGVRDYRRYTYSSGSNTSVVARNLYLPPGRYKISVPVKCSQNGRVLAVWATEAADAMNTAVANGSWQTIDRTITVTTPEATVSAMSVYLNTALTAGNYLETGDVMVEGIDGDYPSDTAPFATGWGVQTGYTMTWQTANPPPPAILNPGNAPSHPRVRMLGPGSNWAYQIGAGAQYQLYPSSYGSGDYAVIDAGFRSVIKNGSASDYGSIYQPGTAWGGVPVTGVSPTLRAFTGASTATRAEMTWRGVWL